MRRLCLNVARIPYSNKAPPQQAHHQEWSSKAVRGYQSKSPAPKPTCCTGHKPSAWSSGKEKPLRKAQRL